MEKAPRKKPQLVVAALVTTVLVAGAAATGSYFWANQNAYAAKVNGEVISSTEYISIVERAKKQYAGQIGMDFNSAEGRSMLENLKKNIMDSMVDMALMKQKAREMNLSVSEDEYAAKFKEFVQSRYQGNEKTFEEDLERNKITRPEFETQFRDQILLQQLYQKVIADIKIEESDLRAFYDKNTDKFGTPEQINAKHILIKADEANKADVQKAKVKADDVLRQLKAGAKFEDMVKKYSDDTGSKAGGGDLGSFKKGMMVPAFEAAAWPMKPGEISAAPVQSNFGWHIIQRGATEPAQTKKYEEVKEMIRGQIKQEKEREVFEKWLKEAKDGAKITINEEMMKVPVAPAAASSGASGAPGAPAPMGGEGGEMAPPPAEEGPPAELPPAEAPPAEKP
ncbi:MAG: peptidylprolyl isomerase [Candidatus Sericytochromatia bacterium]